MKTKFELRFFVMTTTFIGLIFLSSFVFPNKEVMMLKLNFLGLDDEKESHVMIAVYKDSKSFLGDNPFKTFKVATRGKTSFSHEIDMPTGIYGLALFQDLNGDEKMNKNFLGIPTEPYAFSNNAPATFGPPKWKEAVFEFKTERSMDIRF